MKAAIAGILAIAALTAADYVGKHEDFDLDSVLHDKSTLYVFVNCLLDKGPCTPEFEDIKESTIEKFDDGCAKCSPKQLELLKKGFTFVAQNEPQLFDELKDKFHAEEKMPQLFN